MNRRQRIRRELRNARKYQGGWVQILYWLIATIITIALTPKPAAPKPQALEDLDAPTAEENRDLSVIFGKVRITGLNLTWHGAFGTNKIKKSGLFSSSTVGYRYFLGMMMHFCRGPVDVFSRIEAGEKIAWNGNVTSNSQIAINAPNLFGGEKREGGLVGGVDFIFGGATQLINTFVASKVDAPHPGFRGMSGLVYKPEFMFPAFFRKYRVGGAGGYIGTNGYVKPWAVTASRILKGWHNDVVWYPEAADVDGGMNAIHVIYESLTNPIWGGNNPTALIDDANFRYNADLCKAENLGLNIIWAHATKIEDFVQNALDHIAGALGFDPSTGKYVIRLIRGDYDPDDVPLFNNDNMGDIIDFQRRSWGETVNELTVAYTDPDTGKDTDITIQDLGNIYSQKVRIAEKIDRTAFRNYEVARTCAGRELASRSTPLAKIDFKCNRAAYPLLPYGVIKITRTEPEYHLQETVFRIFDIRKGTLEKGQITVSAVEDIYALTGLEYSEVPAPPTDNDPVELPEDSADSAGGVTSTTTTLPPSVTDLVDGQRFLVPAGATGEWAGHAGQIAEWDEDSGEWIFIDVPDGTTIHDTETGGNVEVYNGVANPVGTGNLLTTKGDLLTHDGTEPVRFGVGGDGTVPIADAAEATGWRWGAITAGAVGGGLIFADGSVPSGNTITNTTTETTFLSSYVIPVADLIAGKVITGKLRGVFKTHSAAGTLRLRVKLGGVTILDSTAFTQTNSITDRGWSLEFDVMVLVGGASAQIDAQGRATFGTSATAQLTQHLQNTAYITTVNLAGDTPLIVTAQYSVASVNNYITLRQMLLWAEYASIATPVDVIALLHFDSFDTSTAMVDQYGHTFTAAGNAQIDTAQSKFGGSALLLDGTGDWVAASHVDFLFGFGDFTIEAFVRSTDTSGANHFIVSLGGGWGFYEFGGQWAVFDAVSFNVILGGSCSVNTWYHVAWTRASGTMRLFVNGTQIATDYNASGLNLNSPALRIGAQPGGTGGYIGHIDEVRISRMAKYVANFTAPTVAFDDPDGTTPVYEDSFPGSSVSGAWTVYNPEPLTISNTVSGGTLTMTATGVAGGKSSLLTQAANNTPPAPIHYRAHIGNITSPSTMMVGFGVRNSATGNYLMFGQHQTQLAVLRFDINNWAGSTPFFDSSIYPNANVWLEIVDDGTTLLFKVSPTGVDGSWVTLLTELRSTFILAVNQVFLGIFDGAGGAASLQVHTFQVRTE